MFSHCAERKDFILPVAGRLALRDRLGLEEELGISCGYIHLAVGEDFRACCLENRLPCSSSRVADCRIGIGESSLTTVPGPGREACGYHLSCKAVIAGLGQFSWNIATHEIPLSAAESSVPIVSHVSSSRNIYVV